MAWTRIRWVSLSTACCFFMAFALPAIAHAGNLMTQEILPSDTDPAITRFNEPNVIVFDEEGLDSNNFFRRMISSPRFRHYLAYQV